MDLHIGYETVEPWAVTRTDTPDTKARAAGQAPKSVLKSLLDENSKEGRIVIDSETVLAGIPLQAWSYKLGNRSALDWVLDQHKGRVITLLARVARVSVETVRLVEALKGGLR